MLYMMDIDGTLIEPFYTAQPAEKRTVDTPTPDYDYTRVEFIPNVRERLYHLMVNPLASFALITNQGGVAFGYQTVDQVKDKLAVITRELEFFRDHAFSVHVCYTHPEATNELYLDSDDKRRKPGPGMLQEAMRAHRVRRKEMAIYVGDLPSDEAAAAAADVTFLYANQFFTDGIAVD